MKQAPNGYLFKRCRGKHLPIDSAIPAMFYLSYEIDNHRTTLCLHTTDREIAERLAKEHMGRLDWGSRKAYLRSLVELGEKAKRELAGHEHESNVCPMKELWERYLSSRRRPDSGPSTLAFYKQHVTAFINWLPASAKTIRHITSSMTEQYVRELEQKVSVPTAGKHVGTLRRVWRVVDPDGPQPWRNLQPIGQHVVTPYRRLSLNECRALTNAAKEKGQEEYGCILVGYYTALRLADVIHLRTEHIDQESAVLHLPAPRKTSRRKPAPLHIPMLPELATWLVEHAKSIQSEDGWVFPTLVARYAKDRSEVTKSLGTIFDDAKALDDVRGKASFHSLRATFVSVMDEAGAPARVTDIITNHAPKTMHDRYSHPDIETARSWMEKALKRLG